MRFSRISSIASLGVISALALSACGGGTGSSGGQADASAIITADSVEPQHPLVPTDTNENGGGVVVENIFNGLISYDENGKVENDLAESIDSTDQQNWTIKIKKDKKFTNGEPVTAKSFVDSWNFGAAAKNAQASSSFFSPIEGYDAVSAEGATEDKMSGLKVVDDTTFTVKLSSPESDFAQRLGYTAYAPLPESAFKDIKAFGENPVGYGPYKMAKQGAWQHNTQIDLVKNDDYDGPEKAKNGGITFKLYQNPDTAYQDLLANNLDVLQQIPATDLGTYKDDLPDRNLDKPYAGNQTIAIPEYLKNWSGEAGKLRRQALSKAIDRDEITKVILNNTRKPATDMTAPVLEGYKDNLKNSENTKFNKDEAKKLWDEAEKIQPYDKSEKFTIGYNADAGGHKKWVDAVTNQLKNNLGIEVEGKSYATFKELRTETTAGKLTGAVRSGWLADYPSMYNFMGPIYTKGADSNDSRYDNPEFEATLSEGLKAKDQSEAQKKFQEADSMLLEDLPAIPLWYSQANVGWSENVQNVKASWNGTPMYYNVEKTS
ncbi:peptide ABC transporter substrate-binding protein [Kocuria massiliensis]|uniref:peptide ABC transporter substrate-binding protein n=1 Tax=Kocuria massiliensis TaxID=1926282 RepID=UPI000A1CB790|nr:ABC transporter substrate-binding protein [Kocuria massiliensis]